MVLVRRRSKRADQSQGLLVRSEDSSDHGSTKNHSSTWDALWMSRSKSLACVVPGNHHHHNTASSSSSSLYWDLNDNDDDDDDKNKLVGIKTSFSPTQQWQDETSDGIYKQHETGVAVKSCALTPKFLFSTRIPSDNASTGTEPPSPLSTPPRRKNTASNNDIEQQQPQVLLQESPRSIVSDIRYSLRTSIGDGSITDKNQPPFRQQHQQQKRSLRPNGVRLNVSHWSHVGSRPYMEDRFVVESMGAVQVELSPISDPTKTSRVKMPVSFFGVFDGHGGDKASQYCADWMSSYLKNQPTYPHDLGQAMKQAFGVVNDDFCNTGHADGTTACAVCLVGGKRLVCANAGDSRALVVKHNGSVVRISRDHKPGIMSEAKRIEALGGKVVYWQHRWRVEGLLAVSRGIGDVALKPYVTAEPDICEYNVQPDDLFLLVSSDGVWDTVTNEDAARIVLETCTTQNNDDNVMVIDTEKFKLAAQELCQHAKVQGSGDNFSAICVDLQSCGNPDANSGSYKIST